MKNRGPWMSINETHLPALPPNSRLTVVAVTPDRFEVTYPLEAHFIQWTMFFLLFFFLGFPLLVLCVAVGPLIPEMNPLFAIFIPMIMLIQLSRVFARQFRKLTGGRIVLTLDHVSTTGGTLFHKTQTHRFLGLGPFEVCNVGANDSSHWALILCLGSAENIIAQETDITLPDLKWLNERMNEWLGWEFPRHCVSCGKLLDQFDVRWAERRVCCSDCLYEGPAPDPFAENQEPPRLPDGCPSCDSLILLSEINRETGGCRCEVCGWESTAVPPLRPEDFRGFTDFFQAVFSRLLPLILYFPEQMVSERDLLEEFPAESDAWAYLETELQSEFQDSQRPVIQFNHWRTRGLSAVLGGLSVAVIILVGLLTTVLVAPPGQRTWQLFLAKLVVWCLLTVAVAISSFLIWWRCRRTELRFSPYALSIFSSHRQRLIAWRTLGGVAVHRRGWPPFLVLTHGGAGIHLALPTRKSARALARIMIIYRDRSTNSDPRSPVD